MSGVPKSCSKCNNIVLLVQRQAVPFIAVALLDVKIEQVLKLITNAYQYISMLILIIYSGTSISRNRRCSLCENSDYSNEKTIDNSEHSDVNISHYGIANEIFGHFFGIDKEVAANSGRRLYISDSGRQIYSRYR